VKITTTTESSSEQTRTSWKVEVSINVGLGPWTFSAQGGTGPPSEFEPNVEDLFGGAGAGLAGASPQGYTLRVPDTHTPDKLRAYRKGVLRKEIGRNAGPGNSTRARRNTPEQRAARAQHSEASPPPAEPAPGGKGWAQDHIIELQHDLTGRSGTAPEHYRWQDSALNSHEGSQSWALNKNNPQGVSAGGVARAAEAGKWYHSPAFRGVARWLGRAATVYGAAQSGLHVVDAIQADIEQGTGGAQTAEAVATEAGGWAGALALGEAGAAAGVFCGPLAWVCTPAGGLIGGAVGYFGGSALAEGIIDVGGDITDWILDW